VARAAYFPVLDLSAAGGQRASVWGEIFNAPARFWSLGPTLAASLFDGGLRSAQKAQAQAVWEQAAANYRQTVLASFQEVEDQLASLRILASEAEVQAGAVAAARLAAELVLAQYQAGTVGGLQVIVANNALLAAERSALDLHGRRLNAAVVLIRAFGGGWPEAAPGK
jgi:outer membrane protein TolC